MTVRTISIKGILMQTMMAYVIIGYCSLTSLTLAVKLCAKNIKQIRIQPFAKGEL
ncbi:MAG: hypothetical protein HDT30_05285 [Clostridiales bacterium]|nr:hypothetical protein [Clostridiales bacterium]